MEKNGYVVSSDEKTVKIRIDRESACGGNCAHCKGCSSEMIFEYENSCGFKAGETVRVLMDDRKFLKKSFLVYGLLIISLIAGGILGYLLFESELMSALFSVIALAVVLLVLRKVQKADDREIKVERILS